MKKTICALLLSLTAATADAGRPPTLPSFSMELMDTLDSAGDRVCSGEDAGQVMWGTYLDWYDIRDRYLKRSDVTGKLREFLREAGVDEMLRHLRATYPIGTTHWYNRIEECQRKNEG